MSDHKRQPAHPLQSITSFSSSPWLPDIYLLASATLHPTRATSETRLTIGQNLLSQAFIRSGLPASLTGHLRPRYMASLPGCFRYYAFRLKNLALKNLNAR